MDMQNVQKKQKVKFDIFWSSPKTFGSVQNNFGPVKNHFGHVQNHFGPAGEPEISCELENFLAPLCIPEIMSRRNFKLICTRFFR